MKEWGVGKVDFNSLILKCSILDGDQVPYTWWILKSGTPTGDASIIVVIKSTEKGERERGKQRTTRKPLIEILSSCF